MKVETHNHPTAISPFPGAIHRRGRRNPRRGRHRPRAPAQGRPDRLHRVQVWGGWWDRPAASPATIASPLQIMTEGRWAPRSTTNLAGPTCWAISANTSRRWPDVGAWLPQAHHDRGRPGQIDGGRRRRSCFAGSLLIQLGGPACASAWAAARPARMAGGTNAAELDLTRCSAATRRSSAARRR